MNEHIFSFRNATVKHDSHVPDEYIQNMQFQKMGMSLAKELTKHNKFRVEEHNEDEVIYSKYELIVFHPDEYKKHIQEQREDAIRKETVIIELLKGELKNVYIYLQERERRSRWWKGYMQDMSKLMNRIERFINP